jgi:hypothetical protein
MMGSTDLVLRMIQLFDELSIPYMLVGSFSSNYYGRPRSTKDADFVVVIQDDQLAKLARALEPAFRVDPQMSFETVTMRRRYLIAHTESAFKIELFLFTEDPFNSERFKRRRQVDFEGHSAWLPSPEDVIVQKLLWARHPGRDQDVSDATNVIRVQKNLGLDVEYIRRWTELHGTREVFERLLEG